MNTENLDKDQKLMIMFKNGDNSAFDLLFDEYRIPVFNFLYRMLNGDRETAEDLLQEIFIKVFEGRDYYEPQAKFSTWLYTIARNHCLNLINSKRFKQGRNTLPLDPALIPEEEFTPPSADYETLEDAIGGLPEHYREVFILRAVQELPYEEIAEILGVRQGAVRTAYSRARAMLREKLKPVIEKGERN